MNNINTSLRYKEGVKRGESDKQTGNKFDNPFHGEFDHAWHGYVHGFNNANRVFVVKEITD